MAIREFVSMSVFGFSLMISTAMAADEAYLAGYKPTETEVAYIVQTQNYIKGRLRVSLPARFREIYINKKKRLGYPIVCGQISTNKSSSDQDGWQRFVATPIGDHLSLEKWMTPHEFKKIWGKVCL